MRHRVFTVTEILPTNALFSCRCSEEENAVLMDAESLF
jgi:hypothetical protein